MIPDARRCDDEYIEDRISNLPRHLIDNILDRMLIRDAARTSTLSKTWKNIWETHPHIYLEDKFIKQLILSKEDIQAAKLLYLEVVNSILLAHVGPILTLSLYIPACLNLWRIPYTCLWIKQLSGKGVKVLYLRNECVKLTNDMPSYFFSCLDLTELDLRNWKLNAPHDFRGFRNLTRVILWFVVFTTDMSFGTQVRHFELVFCAGIEHLDIQLTNHGKNIEYLSIARSKRKENHHALDYNPYTDIEKSFNLHRLLGNMPSISTLKLNGTSLAFLNPGLTFLNRLNSTMENLKTLKLYMAAFDDVYVIANALCMLRSLPILECLVIRVDPDMSSGIDVNLTAEQYLESPYCADITLKKLKDVTIADIFGSRAELLLIKLLLASSPSLLRMTLCCNTEADDFGEYIRESLQFPRKSSAVQISWRKKAIKSKKSEGN